MQVCSDMDSLSDVRSNREIVVRAARSAVVKGSWAGSCGSLVINHEEVRMGPSGEVTIDCGILEIRPERCNTHKEVAIVCAVGVANGSFSRGADVVPLRVSIAPVASVAFALPWVSHSDELVGIATQVSDGLSSNHTVSVTVSNSISVSGGVTSCIVVSSSGDDVVAVICRVKEFPELGLGLRSVGNLLTWIASKSLDTTFGPATNELSVVTHKLSIGFLENGHPGGLIARSLDLCEDCVVGGAVVGHVVINDDSDRNTKNVHVESVDSLGVHLFGDPVVLKTVWHLSD